MALVTNNYIDYHIAGTFGGKKVWQIWWIMSDSPNQTLHYVIIIIYSTPFAKLSFAKSFKDWICQIFLLYSTSNLVYG